jgi:exonuclease VII large subunit
MAAARDLWDDIEDDIRTVLVSYRRELTQSLRTQLKSAYDQAKAHEKEAFEQRIREVAALQKVQSIDKLKREIEAQRATHIQYSLLDDADALAEKRLRDLEDELKRRQNQFGDLQERLSQEKTRILEQVLPRRFALRGEAQVFPVTIEIRFPEVEA